MFDIAQVQSSIESMPAVPYAGPERRVRKSLPQVDCLKAALDEIDFGILLLDRQMRALYVNEAARQELESPCPMHLHQATLETRQAHDRVALRSAVCSAATRGLRKQLVLGDDLQRASVSVVPLLVHPDEAVVLLMLGKRRGQNGLQLQSFASRHQLTTAETRVLRRLCDGISPGRIASEAGLAVSTVRTQIASIRAKTDSSSIAQLVHKVSALPPLMCVFREAVPAN